MKVLLTGANGYIGRRLKKKLLQDASIELKIFVRNKKSLTQEVLDSCEVIEGDTLNKESLRAALKSVDVAYYLIHSLQNANYKELDKLSAQNFIQIATECGVKRVIYLGGLGVKNSQTSEHLLSRIETGEVLSSSASVQTICIRAGVIIGSGSASFEIIRNLVEKLPLMLTPKWVNTYAQPIAVADVLRYLLSALTLEYDKNLIVDIGSKKMPYKEMMMQTAKALGLKRYLIPIPLLSITLSSYWLNLFTPVPFQIARALVEGLKSEVVIQNENAAIYFPHITPMDYISAVQQAILEIEKKQVISRWSDADGQSWDKRHLNEISDAIFVDRKERDISDYDKHELFEVVCAIGGANGWFAYDFLWEIRGRFDKAIGGAGINRGRRDERTLRVGESLDFWRVADVVEDERLLLYAQMKLPGDGWLEFKIEENRLIQSAYFFPKGLLGRIYWYALIPLHYLVFTNMIESILDKCKKRSDSTKADAKRV